MRPEALRCVPSDEPDKITADAFDFIEYPKILSQPEADPVELINDAITLFLSRNKVKEDRIAISVPGQSGLARFIKLPPVESKKIPDIVRYEARQQIPFALEDVVWDYQQMAGGSEEDGFSLETEVGLFAMKREQVFRALRPFTDAGIEVDLIQLTPLALYNFVVFDQMQDLPPVDAFDPKDPPPSTIVVSLGTDTTDLVVTNGYRVWQRNIPLGGNHFTKALTKELKLTFAKAEHLKRNALKAEDPKAVFLAMRPVFNDLVTEVQRSISFFSKRRSHGEDRPRDSVGQCDEAPRTAEVSGPEPRIRSRRIEGIPRADRIGRRRHAGVQRQFAVVRRLLRVSAARTEASFAADQSHSAGDHQRSTVAGEEALGGGHRGGDSFRVRGLVLRQLAGV